MKDIKKLDVEKSWEDSVISASRACHVSQHHHYNTPFQILQVSWDLVLGARCDFKVLKARQGSKVGNKR
jgi:hypothetical protein